MLSILLIRSGATEYECQGRIQGALDVPLSEDGRQQMEQVAEQLHEQTVEALYAGPCRATQQSAELLAKQLRVKTKTFDKLANLNRGLWEGMLVDEVKVKQPKVYKQWQERPDTVCPPNGETLQTARDRLQEVLTKIAKKHKSGVVAVVVAEPLVSLLRNVLRNDDLGDLWRVEGEALPYWALIDVPAEVASPS